LFDEWRRAIGVTQAGTETTAQPARKATLTAHLERIVSRLVGRRTPRSATFEQHLERLLTELDRLSAETRQARGATRAGIVERLVSLDEELMLAALAELDENSSAIARREAEAALAPFAARMAPDVRARAMDAAYRRAVRDSLDLPTIRYG
jgi:hypothetical protein